MAYYIWETLRLAAMSGTDLLDNRRPHGSWNESIVLWKGHGLRSQRYEGSVSGSAA